MKKIYIILTVIFILFFLIFYYKKIKLGNTIIKLNDEKFIESILSEDLKYEAKVKVFSNKNDNIYELKIIEKDDESLMEVCGKNNISGLRIQKKNGDLIIKNTKLKLDKIYENYEEITDNVLFLKSFLDDYNEAEEIEKFELNNQIVVKITLRNFSKYIKYKELYFNKANKMPEKMLIKDCSNNTKICIEYINLEIL